MGAFQPWHIIVLAVVVVALFGYNKLPDVTRSVGRSLRIFKTEMKGLSEDDKVREEAKELGLPTVAPSVAPVPLQKDLPAAGTPVVVPPVAATPADPSEDEIARAQAVLAAAAKARSDAAASNGAGPAPERADTAAH